MRIFDREIKSSDVRNFTVNYSTYQPSSQCHTREYLLILLFLFIHCLLSNYSQPSQNTNFQNSTLVKIIYWLPRKNKIIIQIFMLRSTPSLELAFYLNAIRFLGIQREDKISISGCQMPDQRARTGKCNFARLCVPMMIT